MHCWQGKFTMWYYFTMPRRPKPKLDYVAAATTANTKLAYHKDTSLSDVNRRFYWF